MSGPRLSYVGLAALAGTALAAASLLPLDPPDVVPCGFLKLTGAPCPFCGTTRAFTSMGHGLLTQAVSISPLAAILYAATAGLFLFALAGCVQPGPLEPLRRIGADLLRRRWVWFAVAGLIAANWGYRLAVGLK